MKLRNFLICIFLILTLASFVKAEAYKFDFVINENYTIEEHNLIFREDYNFYEDDFGESDQSINLKILDKDSSILYERNISLAFIVFDNAADLEDDLVEIYLPYSEKDATLQLFNKGQVLLDLNIKKELCDNNNLCSRSENYYSCPSDCKVNAEDGVCITFDDGLCDKDCVYDEDCQPKPIKQETKDKDTNNLKYILYISVPIIIILILIILFRKKKRTIVFV